MATRLKPPADPVEFEFDGEKITAERGEPLAFALLAADKLVLARSPKLHRPHGPYCLRGGCDGCLARVNGEPNVTTCLTPCAGGEKVETQNVLGSRQTDLLRVTDWFFPRGIDHHHFMAGVPAASYVVQKVARYIAGLGRLPDEPRPTGTARREEADVLVIGGGLAGLTVARALAANGALRIVVADDATAPGGSLRARGEPVPRLDSLHFHGGTTAAGIYEGEALLVRGDEAMLVRPRALVLATGTHDGVLAFGGNDLPGVLSARAGALLAQRDIAIGRRVALFGSGPYASAFAARTRGQVETIEIPAGATVTARGGGRLSAVTVRKAEGAEETHEADALLVETAGPPAFELAEQAGAAIAFDRERGGYLPTLDVEGRAAHGVFCAGELAGTGVDLAAIRAQAEAVAAAVARELA